MAITDSSHENKLHPSPTLDLHEAGDDKPKSKGWVWILILLIAAGGGYYYFKTRGASESKAAPAPGKSANWAT